MRLGLLLCSVLHLLAAAPLFFNLEHLLRPLTSLLHKGRAQRPAHRGRKLVYRHRPARYRRPVRFRAVPQPRTVAPLSLGRDTNNDAFLAATKDFTLEDVLPLLRSIAADPESAAAADAVIQANAATICVDSLEAGIEAIEAATAELDGVEDDVKVLIAKTETFTTEASDPAKVIRQVGDILRILDPMVPKLRAAGRAGAGIGCAASPLGRVEGFEGQEFSGAELASFDSVAKLEETLADSRFVRLTDNGRKQLKKASKFISTLSTFQEDLKPVVEGFKNICNADKTYNLNSIKALGDLMVKLSDQFGEVNSGRGRQYVDNVVATLTKVGDLGFDLDCRRPDSLNSAARSLDELADLLDDIGIEKLEEDLGIDLSFGLSEGSEFQTNSLSSSFDFENGFNFSS